MLGMLAHSFIIFTKILSVSSSNLEVEQESEVETKRVTIEETRIES